MVYLVCHILIDKPPTSLIPVCDRNIMISIGWVLVHDHQYKQIINQRGQQNEWKSSKCTGLPWCQALAWKAIGDIPTSVPHYWGAQCGGHFSTQGTKLS